MVQVLAAVRKQAGHDGWVGLQCYLIHVSTLHGREVVLGGNGPCLDRPPSNPIRLHCCGTAISCNPNLCVTQLHLSSCGRPYALLYIPIPFRTCVPSPFSLHGGHVTCDTKHHIDYTTGVDLSHLEVIRPQFMQDVAVPRCMRNTPPT
ncbi:hypothetical protein Vretimale_18787 [Volvox reticuliferus]|uniref:Uncharacterized protein n=1 Tax=Volvox reticuliferus TaxID=1737510 RepID=A0A8J4LZ35_9CHLO|nr:hypothetical protein Vretimale_18787 [Volvox reticuliferus]